MKKNHSPRTKKHSFSLEMFSVWAFCCHMWALHELHNIPELHENHFKDDLKNNFEDDLAFLRKDISPSHTVGKRMIWHSRRNISPSQRRCERSFCVCMGPHLVFCADSGAPILKTPKLSLEMLNLGLKFSFSLAICNLGPCFSAAREGLGLK